MTIDLTLRTEDSQMRWTAHPVDEIPFEGDALIVAGHLAIVTATILGIEGRWHVTCMPAGMFAVPW